MLNTATNVHVPTELPWIRSPYIPAVLPWSLSPIPRSNGGYRGITVIPTIVQLSSVKSSLRRVESDIRSAEDRHVFEARDVKRTRNSTSISAFTLATCAATSLRAPADWLIATISGDLWRMELTKTKMCRKLLLNLLSNMWPVWKHHIVGVCCEFSRRRVDRAPAIVAWVQSAADVQCLAFLSRRRSVFGGAAMTLVLRFTGASIDEELNK